MAPEISIQPDRAFRILHFGLAKTIGPGVEQQLKSELDSAGKLPAHLHWDTLMFSHDAPRSNFMVQANNGDFGLLPAKLRRYLNLRISAYSWLKENAHEYDAVLLRYPLGDPLLPWFVKHLGNVFTIHHTLELHEIRSQQGFLSKIQFLVERIVGQKTLNHTKGIVGVTKEIVDYELSRIKPHERISYVCPNGIDSALVPATGDERSGKVKLVCICSRPYPWHGIDLIERAAAENSHQDVEIHLVGNFDPTKYCQDERFIVHGRLETKAIGELLRRCDLGIGSLAMHRNHMTEACSLKTREYLAAGLPVYAHHTDAGLPLSFEYFINEPFDLDQACIYSKQFRNVSKQAIRDAALPYIEKSTVTHNLAHWLYNVSQSSQHSRMTDPQ